MAALAVALVVPVLAACSSKSPSASPARSPTTGSHLSTPVTPTASSPGPDAVCALVPPSAVTGAFGGSVTAVGPSDFFRNPACSYEMSGSNLGVTGTVQIVDLVIYDAGKYETAKRSGLAGGDVVVSGVGDDAFYDPKTTSAVLRKGNTVYFVGAAFKGPVGVVLDAAKIQADTIALARTVSGLLS
jgi:hypothetical protein